MKHTRGISIVMAALFVCGTLLLAGAARAADPDAGVKGLWLKATAFPTAKVEVLEFEDDKDLDMVTYTRMLDAEAVFEIRRQAIADSELQKPEDVKGLITMRVENDDIPDGVRQENLGSITIDAKASEYTKLFTYPCVVAHYLTGANEDTRANTALFIFTDTYCFEISATMPTDVAQDYEEPVKKWFKSLKMVEGKGGK
jgi:hypothetical protein